MGGMSEKPADSGPDPQATHAHGITRRRALQGGVVLTLGAAAHRRAGAVRAGSPDPAALSNAAPLIAAMHVHAVYSEGAGSWEQQYANCVATGVDVMWQTDHDFRARALHYMGLLSGVFTGASTGTSRQGTATFSASGPIRVLVESAGSSPATRSLVMGGQNNAVNSFRTGIDGQTPRHVFGTSRLDAGARYEVVLSLSLHPARSGRPAGQYSLRYRFLRGGSVARFTESRGLVGVVQAPMPANGTTVTLNPQADIAAIWPDMMAIDNVSFLLSFVVTSPHVGVVADVNLKSVTVNRARHDAAGVLAAQNAFASTYSSRYGVAGFASEEISLAPAKIAHCNVFGSPPEFALKDTVTLTNWADYYRAYVGRAHAGGGVVSWNHPFGFTTGPILSAADQITKRQQTFSDLKAEDLLGSDVLEVGYTLRGYMPFNQHIDLWDTFSRQARWLTGNGASDDHSGNPWRSLSNGFLTGLWAASTSAHDLTAALAGGRAYVFHPGRTPGLHLDTLVDGAVPMGAASVSGATSRTVAIGLAALPSDCTVDLVLGPVDHTGTDPGTSILRSWPASAFGSTGTGTVSTAVGTSASCFVRAQVRRAGTIVATGNPTWLLRQPSPGGIPAARTA